MQTIPAISRRQFLASAAAVTVPRFRQILIPRDSPLPVKTAASELAAATGAGVAEYATAASLRPGRILLACASDMSGVASPPKVPGGREWELVQPLDGGLLIAGSTPRNVCRAALGWLADPAGETGRLSTYVFEERFTMWDNSMNQMYRFSKDFDRRRHIREIARLGHTGVEINRYADPGGYHVRHRKFPADSYAWYVSYAPALDAFVESSLTRGIYRADELAANLNDLREAAALARSYGLKPGFVCYEPRCVNEEIFDRYPELRGSRTDHPGRSLQPRYALDIANPLVLEHYAEMLANLMKEVPDLRYFVFWTQDSGSGMPFANRLYFGPNGSFLARSKTIEEMTADFTRALAEAGRKINPEFEVIMEIGHEYTEDERKRITAALPKGVTLSHPAGGSLLKGGALGAIETYVRQDREAGVEPYPALTISAGFDAEPIIGVPFPSLLFQKFTNLEKLHLRRLFNLGGVWSPPQCPFHINQELFAELIRGTVPDLNQFLTKMARRWCDDDHEAARALVQAWQSGDRAIAAWPKLNWYTAGPGQTQARWITRPLVPDLTRLAPRERAAWERALFTLPGDIGRWNVVFEGGIRFFQDEDFERAVRAYDQEMIPGLVRTIAILEDALKVRTTAVIEDQRDRYRGLLLRSRTDRNLFEAQVAINNYLLKRGDPEVLRGRLKAAIRADIANTADWIDALTGSRACWFHVAAREETPFLHKTPVEDLKLKLAVMQQHIDDEPGPYLKQILERKPKLQFSAVQ
jgi:hypothetical protein